MPAGIDWTREEHILAFNLYCKIPFGTFHQRNPKVIELASIIGRTPGSVAMKLGNFTRKDRQQQARGIKGLSRGAKGEVSIWQEFENDPEAFAFQSEELLAKYTGRTIEDVAQLPETELPRAGIERERIVRVRVNQAFFRTTVLAAYKSKCCVTGLAIPELLVASHIVPWSKDSRHRLNPRNGLCLNALHDRAFDRGLMYIDDDFKVRFHSAVGQIKDKRGLNLLLDTEGADLTRSAKFPADPEMLRVHRLQATGS